MKLKVPTMYVCKECGKPEVEVLRFDRTDQDQIEKLHRIYRGILAGKPNVWKDNKELK